MKSLRTTTAVAAFMLCGSAMAAVGSTASYTFDQHGTNLDISGGNYGTVLLTETAAGVTFDVSLRSDLNFVTSGNQKSKAVFAFNATGVSLGDISTATDASNQTFTAVAPGNDSPFGSFTFGFLCATNCSNGGSAGGYPDPLHFTVANAVLGDFAFQSTLGSPAAYFSADVFTSLAVSGNTGAIGVTQPPVTAVPEPETYALMLAGLGAVGWAVRRRRAPR